MKLPRLDQLIGEQLAVYEYPIDQHLFVAGPPGSGKTTLAVLRAKFIQNVSEGASVVVVTRNKMLVALIEQQMAQCRTTTMHKLVWHDCRNRVGGCPPDVFHMQFDWFAIGGRFAERQIGPIVDHLIVDEAQNLPPSFIAWAARYYARALTVFADEDQTTDADGASFSAIHAAGMPLPVRLTQNHRNTVEIAQVAEHFHRSRVLPPAIVRDARRGEMPELLQVDQWGALVERVRNRVLNQRLSVGVIVYTVLDIQLLYGQLRAALPQAVRVNCYQSDGPFSDADAVRSLEPGVTVISGESAIGLEFDVVFLQDLARSLPPTGVAQFRRMYMLCARARDVLVLVDGPQRLDNAQLGSLPGPQLLRR